MQNSQVSKKIGYPELGLDQSIQTLFLHMNHSKEAKNIHVEAEVSVKSVSTFSILKVLEVIQQICPLGHLAPFAFLFTCCLWLFLLHAGRPGAGSGVGREKACKHQETCEKHV